jgi:hypothetical protein
MPRYKIEFDGVGNVKRKLGKGAANRLRKRIGHAIKEGTYDMAEQAYENAPKDTTALANSIMGSVEREAPLTWYFGSTLPYAQRQEYEHKTKKAYFRRAIWQETPLIYDNISHMVKDHFK